MVQWVIGSIFHGGSIELFLIPGQCSTTGVTKDVVCYPVCGMVHIKEPLLLIQDSNSSNGSSRFPLFAI